jgi:hypothetical protein
LKKKTINQPAKPGRQKKRKKRNPCTPWHMSRSGISVTSILWCRGTRASAWRPRSCYVRCLPLPDMPRCSVRGSRPRWTNRRARARWLARESQQAGNGRMEPKHGAARRERAREVSTCVPLRSQRSGGPLLQLRRRFPGSPVLVSKEDDSEFATLRCWYRWAPEVRIHGRFCFPAATCFSHRRFALFDPTW